MTTAIQPLDAVTARSLTESIRSAVETTYSLLLEAWEREAWRALGYASWTAYIDGEFEFNRQRSYQLLQAARVVKALSTAVDTRDEFHITEREARDIAPVLPSVVAEAQANVDAGMAPSVAVRGAVTSAREAITRQRVADSSLDDFEDGFADDVPVREFEDIEAPSMPSRLAPLMTSETPEWYTPAHVIELVTEVLGGIDLDPCADPGKRVPAKQHFTPVEDGLAHEWTGTVYMNPPYGDAIVAWVKKLVAEQKVGRVTESIALVPARTDTAWWNELTHEAAVCFVKGRLRFSGSETGAPFPSAAVYVGPRRAQFTTSFVGLGSVWERRL